MSNPAGEEGTQPQTSIPQDSHESREMFGFTLNVGYMKGIHGLLRAGETVLTLLGFICVAASRNTVCDFLHAATYNFFEFVSISAFLSTLIIYIIYILDFNNKFLLKFVPWLIADAIWCVVYALFFLIASSVLAAHYCSQGGNQAGAAFGFFSCFAIGADGVLSLLQWKSERTPSTSHSPPQDLPGQTLEQY